MWFGVLGRLEVRTYGAPVQVTAPARRQVLAALLARPGSLVTASTLIDDLWGYAAPRSAVGSLRSHVARLRDDLGRDQELLVTEGDGYRLTVEATDIDAGRFEMLVRQAGDTGNAAAAIASYDEALALWRDDAYVEFGEAPFAVHERIRLGELRSLARERRTDLALATGIAGELLGELQQRVRVEPYRERGWEQLALALYRAGRQADALDACRRAREVLCEDLGVDPGPGLQVLEEQLLGQDPALLIAAPPPAATQPVVDRCPYLGLAGYDEHDAGLFVGRERLTSMLAGRLADQSIVLVTGASGVGKSSLVRAGLVPALRAGALPGSAAWRIEVTTPGAAQVAQLGRRTDVVILDQAEQLFTGLAAAERDELVRGLLNYVQYGGGRLVVVLRSDFYGRLATVDALAPLAETTAVLVGPMRADELRRALVEPAAAAGLQLEEDLLETVMDDVAGQPEPLPLLSEAMVRTWQRRDGGVLTLDGYRRSGELAGALEAAAEECYSRLGEPARRAARHVLVRMAAPSGTGGWVRRRLDLATATAGPEREALDALVAARLAIVSGQQVELAHDALLERWPRLREWLDERTHAAELVEHLDQAATTWRTSGRQDADLYRGPRLSAAIDWRSDHPEDVSPIEDEFLDASTYAADAELAAAREQVAREVAGRRRLRRVVVALVAVVLFAVAGGVTAVSERGTAQSEADRAEQAALTADSSRLAALAGSLPRNERDVALLLGAEGYELQPSDETAGGLQTALMQTPPGLDRVIRYRSASPYPHLDRTGKLLAVPGADGSVEVFDVSSGRLVRTMHWRTARQFAVFSGDDHYVAAGGPDGTVVVWDLRTGKQSGAPLRVGGAVVRPVFDPHDANRVYVLSERGALTVWDRTTPAHPHLVGTFSGIAAANATLTISSDGRLIAAGGLSNGDPAASPQIWDASPQIWGTGSQRPLRTAAGTIGTFASSGRVLPFGFGDDTRLVNAGNGRVVGTIRGTGGAALATLSPDGRRVAIPERIGSASVVSVYDVSSGRPVGKPLELHANAAYPVGFLPDGRLVTTGPNEAAVWTLDQKLPPIGLRLDTLANRLDLGGYQAPYFIPGSRQIAVFGSSLPGYVPVYDRRTGRPVGSLLDHAAEPILSSPDGRLFVVQVRAGIGLWDVAARRLLALLPGLAGVRSPTFTDPHASNYAVTAFQWSASGNLIAADVGGSALDVWDVSNPRNIPPPRQLKSPGSGLLEDLRFTADGRGLVVLSGSGTRLSVVDATSGDVVWTREIGSSEVRQLEVSADGKTVAYDSGDSTAGQVSLLDARTGKTTITIDLPSWGGVNFLNQGRWLVITSDQPEPAARLYDVRTGEAFGVPFPTGDVDQHSVAVDPSGSRFAEALGDDVSQPTSSEPFVWTTDPRSWIQTACTIAGRNLTRAEWAQYLPDRPYQLTCPELPSAS